MALSKSLVTPSFMKLHSSNPPTETEDPRPTVSDTAKGNRGGGGRRRSVVLTITGTLIAQVFIADQVSSSSSSSSSSLANAADFFNLVSEPEPERSLEDAQEGMRKNAKDIVGTKEKMMEKRMWREAQRELRRSAGNMKQDMYIIIQAKPPKDRPLLRALYSNLFNNITKLDYAARDEDEAKVLECYKNIVTILDDIFSRI